MFKNIVSIILEMACCFMLAPAFTIDTLDSTRIREISAERFGMQASDVEVYGIVPLSQARDCTEIAIKFKQSTFSLSSVEALLTQRDQLQQQLAKTREALQAYTHTLSSITPQPDRDAKYARRLQKLKQLDADNKKLRGLLRAQLENAESLRVATQETVDTLRKEFDTLVKELMAIKKKDENPDRPVQQERRRIKSFKVPQLNM